MKFRYEGDGERKEVEMPQAFVDELLRLEAEAEALVGGPYTSHVVVVFTEVDTEGRKKRNVPREVYVGIDRQTFDG